MMRRTQLQQIRLDIIQAYASDYKTSITMPRLIIIIIVITIVVLIITITV
jgi:hypothetical protein